MDFIRKLLPITEWLSRYKLSYLRGDLSAGLTVGVLLIPQGMAYALIAGLPPVYGLYAALVPQIIYAIFGTSRQLSVAPVAMDSLLVAAGIGVMATEGTEAYIAFAILLALIMGVFQILLGTFRLGFITNLLSKPVISGFTSAAAIIIGINQLKYLLGIKVENSKHIAGIIQDLFGQLDQFHFLTFVIGVLGIGIIWGIKKINKNIPASLIAVGLGIIVTYSFQLTASGVDIIGSIPAGLPSIKVPELSVDHFLDLAPLALTISVVAFMEAFSVSKAIESKRRDHVVRPNQELIALGASNVIGSFFQSYPVTGGFSRTAVNNETGANTPLASIISASLVGLTLLFLTPLFYYLPEAILASVIMIAVASLIDFRYALQLWKDSKAEFLLLVFTFLITLIFGMVPGIVSGIVLSILILLYKAAYPHIAQLGRVKGHHEYRNVKRFKDLDHWENLLILRVDAPLTFINIQYFKEYVERAILKSNGKINTVILDAGPISHLDATASDGLRDLLEKLHESNIQLLLCDLIGPVRDTLHRTGLIDILGKENVFFDLTETVRFATTHREGRFKEYALQVNVDENE